MAAIKVYVIEANDPILNVYLKKKNSDKKFTIRTLIDDAKLFRNCFQYGDSAILLHNIKLLIKYSCVGFRKIENAKPYLRNVLVNLFGSINSYDAQDSKEALIKELAKNYLVGKYNSLDNIVPTILSQEDFEIKTLRELMKVSSGLKDISEIFILRDQIIEPTTYTLPKWISKELTISKFHEILVNDKFIAKTTKLNAIEELFSGKPVHEFNEDPIHWIDEFGTKYSKKGMATLTIVFSYLEENYIIESVPSLFFGANHLCSVFLSPSGKKPNRIRKQNKAYKYQDIKDHLDNQYS